MEDKRVVFYIIVPVYNSERFLSRCITSIIQQSFSDYRLILIDDGSTDSSGAICDSFAKDNSNVIVLHQTNQGQILARLAGIKYAKDNAHSLQKTEPYIVFADSDDSLKPKALEKIHAAILENNYADLIVYGYDKISESGNVLEKYNQKIYFSGYTSDKHTILKTITAKTKPNYCSLWSKAVKLSLMGTDYNEDLLNLKFGEDAIQSYELFCKCKDAFFMNESLYNYTINKASVSFTMNPVKGIEDTIVGTAFILMQFKSLNVLSNEDLKYFYIDSKRTLISKLSGIVNSRRLKRKEKLRILSRIPAIKYFSVAFPSSKEHNALYYLKQNKILKAFYYIRVWSIGQFFKYAYIKTKNVILARQRGLKQ